MEIASMNALNRPVLITDITEALGCTKNGVSRAFRPQYPDQTKLAKHIRSECERLGLHYDPIAEAEYYEQLKAQKRKAKAAANEKHIDFSAISIPSEPVKSQREIGKLIGVRLAVVNRALRGGKDGYSAEIRKLAQMCGYENRTSAEYKAKKVAEKAANSWWYDTPFHTKGDRIAYFRYLRSQGFGNTEIAKKAGTTRQTVRRNIGSTPADLAKHNRIVGAKLGVVKRMARKQYLRNKPIAEYNAKVDERNALKEKMAKLDAEIAEKQPAIEKLAAQKIPAPQLNLSSLSPTPLM